MKQKLACAMEGLQWNWGKGNIDDKCFFYNNRIEFAEKRESVVCIKEDR